MRLGCESKALVDFFASTNGPGLNANICVLVEHCTLHQFIDPIFEPWISTKPFPKNEAPKKAAIGLI